jgi:cation:H+ antiporter
MPELLVCLKGVQEGAANVAVGNVVGSNIANILLIAGAGALIRPISTRGGGLRREACVMVLATLAFGYLAMRGGVTREDGMVLVGALLANLLIVFVLDRKAEKPIDSPAAKPMPAGAALLCIGIGLAALIFGADALVRGASSIALAFGVSQAVIGLTLVAVGTSLPELTISVISALRGQNELALGNVIGSNLFNITAVIGLTATVTPFSIDHAFLIRDIPIMAGTAIALCVLVFVSPKLGRLSALASLILHGLYMACLATAG